MTRKRRIIQPDFPIHITARSHDRRAFPVPLEDVWETMSRHLYFAHHAWGIQIISFVLMPNHFHLITIDPEMNLSSAMRHVMQETSREIGTRAAVINQKWGGRFHSSVIQSTLYFLHAYKYVYRNPVQADLCARAEDYPFSTLRGLLGAERCLIPVSYDNTLWDRDVEHALKWLNEDYLSSDREAIGAALKKSEFKFRLDPSNRNPSTLEEWQSVPFDPENYEKEPGTLYFTTPSFFAGSEAPPPARFG